MTPDQKRALVANWLLLQRTPEPDIEREDLSWVVVQVWDLCDYAPQHAFEFIVDVLDKDSSEPCMALLCAGPLEALLRKHGPRIIHRVERRARKDAKFADLLGYVWKNSVADSIWARIERARERARALAGVRVD